MLNKCKVVLSAALIFAGASAATAQRGGIPTIDIQKGCRAAEAELKALFSGTGDVYDACVNDEQEGHDQLAKEWGTFPALAKRLCVQPTAYLPSYVEWLTCIELTRDVINLRKAASQAAGKGGKPATSRECPVVTIGDDGNVVSVETRCGR
jgi:hypothetical protein